MFFLTGESNVSMVEDRFNEVSGLKTRNFIKKRFQNKCFPVNISKFLRTPILKNICEPLLRLLEVKFGFVNVIISLLTLNL